MAADITDGRHVPSRPAMPRDGLVSHYPMDADTSDHRGNNHGNNGGTVLPDGGRRLEATDTIVVPPSASLDINDELSISMWVNVRSAPRGAWGAFVAHGEGRDSNPSGYTLGVDPELRLVFRCGAGDFHGADRVPMETWVHVVARYDREGRFTMFTDGDVHGTASMPGGLGTPRAPWNTLAINRLHDPFAPVAFDIDDLLVFARSLSDEEIARLYDAGRGRPCRGPDLPPVSGVAAQPLAVHARRMAEALEFTGTPLSKQERQTLEDALGGDDAALVAGVQAVLDPLCLLGVNINPESRVKVAPGPAAPVLLEQGWSQFLVKVHNEAGVTAELKVSSPQGGDVYKKASPNSTDTISAADIRDRWCDVRMFNGRPLRETLSGLELEYRIIQIYSRDAGPRAAVISFDVGQGSQDVGFRSETSVLFDAVAAVKTTFDILDHDGQPATAGLTIRDERGNVHPSQSKRLAPDFFFHPQVYRRSGESVLLPPGTYMLEYSRGPEYLIGRTTFHVGDRPGTVNVRLARWIDPSALSWWSGDHHIHAAGCAHYTTPSEGVHPPDMLRQIAGEDLKIGCNLTWGPCFDYQKQFFTGADDTSSTYPYLLRYDIEVSGFGSHRSGHLCLLRLKDQLYPGGDSKDHWPTLGLNTLRWAKKQGAVCGPAHSGAGLDVPCWDLPNDIVPNYDGIGANEFIVDVTHDVEGPDGRPTPAVDFISTVDTNYFSELNMWYHTLNVGYRVRASGETDFPCITGERVGLGRSYVKLAGKLNYHEWCEGLRQGRSYVSEGHSHLMDFRVDDAEVGTYGSERSLRVPGTVTAAARVAAYLPAEPLATPDRRGLWSWNLERARLKGTRKVTVELVVNARPVAKKEITADGSLQDLVFEDVRIDRSSWVAMRIAQSSHTNPVFVLVGDRPIRASRRSAQWCLDGVERCWRSKEPTYDADEMADARAAYDHARDAYRRRLAESDVD